MKSEVYFWPRCKTNFFLVLFLSGLKNTQDQIIHLQHIIQLLPLINRDTLYVLLQFLGLVAENAEDRTDETGKQNNEILLASLASMKNFLCNDFRKRPLWQ